MNSKIIVGLSGGVDSSMSLVYLKEMGWDPIGVTLRLPVWEKSSVEENMCCTDKSVALAGKVCEKLDIPHYIYDVRDEFKEEVVGYFLSELKAGRTPNPCVVCNRDHKFKYLFQFADEKGVEYVASGHYARTEDGKLLRPRDREKDQTYYLSLLEKEDLKRIVFPLGDKLKDEVRERAEKEGFSELVGKKESQNWCFVADKDPFIKEELGTKKGEIIYNGDVVGHHEGSWFYTIGQRKGLEIPNGPYYVKDIKNNRLIVTKDKDDLLKKEVTLSPFHIISGKIEEQRVMAKTRYGQELSAAKLKPVGDKLEIIFDEARLAPTPGQFCVFYNKDICLGGGTII